MWFFPSRAGQWPTRQSPWAQWARALWSPARDLRASPAGFRLPGGRSLPAHSIPAWRAAPVLGHAVGQPAVAGPELKAWRAHLDLRPESDGRDSAGPGPRREHRPGRTEPVELVDSMEVPGRFFQWIPKCLDCVWNVFSCRLEHLHCDTGISHWRRALQILCTPSHTVPHQEKHPSGERFDLRKRVRNRNAGTGAGQL